MARLSREYLKDRINEAVFDALDELETELDLTTEKEAQIITDAIFNALSESDNDELTDAEFFGEDEVVDEKAE